MRYEKKIELVKSTLDECCKTKMQMRVSDQLIEKIVKTSCLITEALKDGKKVIVFGNGGSASDAQHFTGELVGKFMKERRALPAIALTTNSSVITAVANDYSFEDVFSRQIESLANFGDIVVAISTSGNSKNVLKAIRTAQNKVRACIGLTGSDGGELGKLVDININVPSIITPRIQEEHITIIHIICDLIEREMFE